MPRQRPCTKLCSFLATTENAKLTAPQLRCELRLRQLIFNCLKACPRCYIVMGVAGLWDILRPAAQTRSLTDLAIKEGFQANLDGRRGFRLGIDASIWFFHAEYGKEGENPVLRTLFFRCATLMRTTFLPIFIFDGPKRPDVKRGKKINKTSHKLIPGMKQIVEAFGFEWRTAPGEAEAELAYLNRIGVIDGILSDDVDNFLFGATVVVRNSSNTLSGNRANPVLNAAGKDDKNHTRIFRLQDISSHPEIQLTRGGMILIGLMSGGDYQQGGIIRCGTTIAHGLAKCGFGDRLYTAATNLSRDQLAEFLITWRHELCHELRTNSRGKIGRKHPALSNAIPEDFPNIDVLFSYVRPITSESMGRESNNLKLTWAKEPDLGKLAGLCEFYFEWGYKESIIKRFRTVMWHSMTLRILRRAVLNLDARAKASTSSPPTTPKKKGNKVYGTPSKLIAQHFSSLNIATPSKRDVFDLDSDEKADTEEPLLLKIHGTRTHVSTDGMLEYRLEIAPKQLVRMAESGIKGTRVPEGLDEWASEEDEDEGAKTGRAKGSPIDPETHLRLWMPACMVALVEPELVEEYQNIQAQRGMKKSKSNRAGTREGKTSNQTANKGKSKAEVDALIDIVRTPSSRKPRPISPTPGISSSTQIKTLGKGKSKAKADAWIEMTKTSPGRKQRSASPARDIPSYSTQIKTTSQGKSKTKVSSFSEMVKKASPIRKKQPTFPTHGVSRSSQIQTFNNVIEVSSDSESDDSLPSRIALPPLIAARARATTKSTQITALTEPRGKASQAHTIELEIIDLT